MNVIIYISARALRTRGTKPWIWNGKLAREGHIEFVFNFIPGHLGVLVWINWEVN